MKTWHQAHAALFGNKIPPEMAEAWTGVWGSKGFTNQLLTMAVLRLAVVPADKRPQWPTEHIEAIEKAANAILLERAPLGQLGSGELALALELAESSFAKKQAEAKKKCVGFHEWDAEKGLPEAREFHRAKALLAKIKQASAQLRLVAPKEGKHLLN